MWFKQIGENEPGNECGEAGIINRTVRQVKLLKVMGGEWKQEITRKIR